MSLSFVQSLYMSLQYVRSCKLYSEKWVPFPEPGIRNGFHLNSLMRMGKTNIRNNLLSYIVNILQYNGKYIKYQRQKVGYFYDLYFFFIFTIGIGL